jgi:mRNA-degrading endonuclease RelE of RelBE toxin-antitoxin system
MHLVFTRRFDRSLREAPDAVRRAFWKQARFLLQDLGHPSLHAKKIDERDDVWQARVNLSWRFYFKIIRDEYHLIDITRHPK